MKKISVIGSGCWGTCIAVLLAENGNDVSLWCRRKENSVEINKTRENKQYLPGIKIPKKVTATNSMQESINHSEIIIVAVPSQFFRGTMQKIKPFYKNQIILSATKGLEHSTFKRMSEVIFDELKSKKIAVLSGPNHSEEVSTKKPTASVIACSDPSVGKMLCDVFNSQNFKAYHVSDVVGVELCGAMKNIIAIAIGTCDGAKLGDNAKGSIITLGLMEMNELGKHFGSKKETVYGLAGVGDLVTTCISVFSRNRFVGESLAKGKSLDQIKKEMHGMVAEGVSTTKVVYDYAIKHKINLPLTSEMYKIIYEKKKISDAIQDLLNISSKHPMGKL